MPDNCTCCPRSNTVTGLLNPQLGPPPSSIDPNKIVSCARAACAGTHAPYSRRDPLQPLHQGSPIASRFWHHLCYGWDGVTTAHRGAGYWGVFKSQQRFEVLFCLMFSRTHSLTLPQLTRSGSPGREVTAGTAWSGRKSCQLLLCRCSPSPLLGTTSQGRWVAPSISLHAAVWSSASSPTSRIFPPARVTTFFFPGSLLLPKTTSFRELFFCTTCSSSQNPKPSIFPTWIICT